MKYAVLQTGGKQYKVSEGSEIEVEKIDSSPNSSIIFDQVLLVADDGAYELGRPNVSGASVKASVLEQKKGEKIRVSKFKAKARYRKTTGHRQLLTRVKIEKITIGDKSAQQTESPRQQAVSRGKTA